MRTEYIAYASKIVFPNIPEHIEKLPMYYFLADVEDVLVHGIVCRALFFFAAWQDAFAALPIYLFPS